MKAFKLFRLKKNGDITSLFINKKRVLNIGEWMGADNYPTKGFAERMGWHSLKRKSAPHLSKRNRIWGEVEIQDIQEFQRPKNQGGIWYLSNKMKINKILK
jgi:hypothetical protein